MSTRQDGFRAYHQGKGLRDNPFPPVATRKHDAWNEGWQDAYTKDPRGVEADLRIELPAERE